MHYIQNGWNDEDMQKYHGNVRNNDDNTDATVNKSDPIQRMMSNIS